MKIFPSKKINLITYLEKEEVLFKLKENTEKIKNKYPKKKSKKIYEGNIDNDCFLIQKIIYSRNSFSPQIKGTIIDKKNKIKIELEFELRSFTYILVLMFSIAIGISFIATFGGIFTLEFSPLICLAHLIILMFLYFNMYFEFNRETESVELNFKNILQGTITTRNNND